MVHVVTPTCCSNLFVRSRHPGSGLGDSDLGRDAQISLLPATTLFQGIPWQAKWHNVHSLSVPSLFPDTTKTPLRPIQMPNLPQLTPSSVEKLCLYSVPLSNDREPRPSPVHCSVSLNWIMQSLSGRVPHFKYGVWKKASTISNASFFVNKKLLLL